MKRFLVSFLLLFVASLASGETTCRDCFEIVPGDIPHIAYSRKQAVDFAIDCFGERGWMVTQHCPRGWANVILASKGDVVNDQLFTHSYSSVDAGPNETFTFAFRWASQINEAIVIEYGWVTLGTNNGALTIIASEVADEQGVAIVGFPYDDETEEVVARPDISLWKTRDHGDWMELASRCIPSETEGYVVIPKEINGKPVRVIGDGAFVGCQRITGVRIPSSVVEIGKSAFDGCRAVASVELPPGLNIIRDSAFSGCVNLRTLTLPADIGTIERYAFPRGTPIVVHLPGSDAERIVRLMRGNPMNASDGYDPYVALAVDPTKEEREKGMLTWQFFVEEGEAVLDGDMTGDPSVPVTFSGRLEIPSELAGLPLTAIRSHAFVGCEGITSVKIPNTVRAVWPNAFSECFNIREVEVPSSLEKVEGVIFGDSPDIMTATLPGGEFKVGDFLACPDKLRVLTIAEGSTIVGENEFAGCQSLISVTFPSTLRSIEPCAFQSCHQLKSLILPEGLLEVGEFAFDDCNELLSLTFPTTLRKIERNAFSCCYKLASLDLPEGLLEVGENAFDSCENLRTLHIPGSLSVVERDTFKNLNKLKVLTFGEGVRVIGDEAFLCCNELQSVVFPSTLVSVGDRAFADCSNLRTAAFPDGLLEIGCDAFSFSALLAVKIPGSVATIGAGAFRNICVMKSVAIGEGVCIIDEQAFQNCYDLESVSFPTTLLSIGREAFFGCQRLTALDLPNGLLNVESAAFDSCGAKTLKVPGSMTFIGNRAFVGMYELETLILEEGVFGIAEGAFSCCDKIEKIVFPSTLQYIGAWAFDSCRTLRSLDLPNGLLMVDDCAFVNCQDVVEINVPSSLIYVGECAFAVGPKTIVRVEKGEVARVSEMFADARIMVEEGQIVEEGHLARSEMVELADQLVAETFTPAFMQEFAALPPGAEVVVAIPNALPGLCYAIGVSTTIAGLGQALEVAQRAVATSEGVEITIVKPEGDSAFFRMAVDEP